MKTSIIKKITAVLTAAALTGSLAACSADKSWAVKNSSESVPIGAYIYNLYSAYQSASSSVPDSTKPVLSQKIDNKDAAAWINAKALTGVKSILVIDGKIKQMNLKLTDTEVKSVSDTTDSLWSQYQSTMEKYGIAKTSFNLALSDYYTKYEKVFNSTYGKGGSKEVPDAELKSFFEKNYSDFSYIALPLYTTDTSGNFKAALSDADKKKKEAEFDDYAAKIKAGTMTIDAAAAAYEKSAGATSNPLNTETINLSTDTNYPQAFKDAVKAMQPGEIKATELSSLYTYVLIVKNDIAKKTDTQLKTADSRKSLLSDYKGKEFSDEISKEADALKDVSVNDAALNSYNPSMFVDTASSAAQTASSK
jgi:hypothetical protein